MVALAVSFVSVYVFSVNEVLSKPTYLCAKRNDGPFKIFGIDLFYVYECFTYMYMCMSHTHACCSWSSEEDIRFPRNRVIDNCKLPVGARDQIPVL